MIKKLLCLILINTWVFSKQTTYKILNQKQIVINYKSVNIMKKEKSEERKGMYKTGTKNVLKGLLKLEKENYLKTNNSKYIQIQKNEKITIIKTKKTKRIKVLSKKNFKAYYIKKYKVYAIKYKNKSMDFFSTKELIKFAKKSVNKLETISPIKKITRISSSFGNRIHPITRKNIFHNGIDLVAPIHTKIMAIADGIIIKYKREHRVNGNYIIIKHKNNIKSYYLHMSYLNKQKRKWSKVKKGEYIGKLGNSGRSTGPHLHLGIKKQDKWINPWGYIYKTTKLKSNNKKYKNNYKLKSNILKQIKILKREKII